jgi:hypothetical protein
VFSVPLRANAKAATVMRAIKARETRRFIARPIAGRLSDGSQKRARRLAAGRFWSADEPPALPMNPPLLPSFGRNCCSGQSTAAPGLFGSLEDPVNPSITIGAPEPLVEVWSSAEVEFQPPSPSTSSRARARRALGVRTRGFLRARGLKLLRHRKALRPSLSESQQDLIDVLSVQRSDPSSSWPFAHAAVSIPGS